MLERSIDLEDIELKSGGRKLEIGGSDKKKFQGKKS
jgi:hypothetical protein